MSVSHGIMMGKKDALALLQNDVQDSLPKPLWDKYERAVNRVWYEFDKLDRVKPKLYKMRHGNDYWKCGNCGTRLLDVSANYCHNCGFEIKWDGIRCLTGYKDKDNE